MTKYVSLAPLFLIALALVACVAPPAEAHGPHHVRGFAVVNAVPVHAVAVSPSVNVQVVNQRRGVFPIFGRRQTIVNVQAFR